MLVGVVDEMTFQKISYVIGFDDATRSPDANDFVESQIPAFSFRCA